ncbi:MAG: hypothetical protein OIN83_10845 [Candidatus Methanoperedens sp.]|nr:hypothetical protein [Candidatus Methanoperedens sp.]
MEQKRIGFYHDTKGFSTALDIFLFLILISISAMILLPSITGNTQIKSALESKNQENSGDVLLTLLNGRVDEYEYIVAGNQLDALAGRFNNSSVFITGKKVIAGKELKHKTFSDIAAENAAAQWVIYYNGTRTQLNFMMTNNSDSSKRIMKNYLNKQIGDRYNYNFTVLWRPFTNVPIGGNLDIGEPVPDNAYIESVYITMPYHIGLSRKQVEDIIDNNFNGSKFGNFSFTFEELKNNENIRDEIEASISHGINETISDTIDDSIDLIVDEKLAPVLDDARNKMIEDINGLVIDSDIRFDQGINDKINDTLDSASANLAGTMAEKLKIYLKKAAKEEIQESSGVEIRAFTTELADMFVNNAITIVEAKDRIITEVFSRIHINRAQATLSLWEKKR